MARWRARQIHFPTCSESTVDDVHAVRCRRRGFAQAMIEPEQASSASGMFTERVCPLCCSIERRVLFTLTPREFCPRNPTYRADYSAITGVGEHEPFPIVACGKCGFVFSGRLPRAELLDIVYDSLIDNDAGLAGSLSPNWRAHQALIAARVLETLGSGREDAVPKVLDYGCGFGGLMKMMKAGGVDCIGFETSSRSVAFGRREGLEILNSLGSVSARGPFDAIVLSDVLEHLPHPIDVLRVCEGLLRRNGILYVSVPDFPIRRLAAIRRDVSLGKAISQEVNPWEHLNYFNSRSLHTMLRAAGLIPFSGPRIDVGLRPNERLIPRLKNSVMSAIRALQYGATGRAMGTAVLARPLDAVGQCAE